jgi:hypothetical protein
VLDVVPFEEEDESPFVGLLQVEAAWRYPKAAAAGLDFGCGPF